MPPIDPALVEAILVDIADNHRTFLPGPQCNNDQLRDNLAGAVLFDGLTSEESLLILSTLPRGAAGIAVSPMDKGLSGAKVLQGRFRDQRGRLSKPFVLKLGPPHKILREAHDMLELVSPFIPGAVPPVVRVGPSACLVVQELAGLSTSSTVVSLRSYSRLHADSQTVVSRLFDERLRHWYSSSSGTTAMAYGSAFEWYLEKASSAPPVRLPSGWEDLQEWVSAIAGYKWLEPAVPLRRIVTSTFDSPETVVHGDLHSQNVVVDERNGECWPIDFGWCHDGASPLVDYVMLEVSLKFLALPMRADLRSLLAVEWQLLAEPMPIVQTGRVPYSDEIENVVQTVLAVRSQAIEHSRFTFEEYRNGLFLMTYAHANHTGLNRPMVLASLQMLTGLLS